jgi:plasmid rolling circle replication initiator protein Rep
MPENVASRKRVSSPMVPRQDRKITPEGVYLSDLSKRDESWDKNRAFSDRVESHYRGSVFHRYSDRIHDCAQILSFGLTMQDDATLRLKLKSAKFCRVRYCPVCQFRRSMQWKARAYKVLPKIVEQYPTHRWLFLTLTQKNVEITSLRATLKEMNSAFQRMTKLNSFPAIGWLKSMEVTRGKKGDSHPHFHCLLLVPRSYFGRRYLKQSDWAAMWKQSLRLDYTPVIDIRPVKEGDYPMSLIPELIKYSTKGLDLVSDRDWLIELTRQTHKMRAISTGGVLKSFLHELEEEPADLIGTGDDGQETIEEYGRLYFAWQRQQERYRMTDPPEVRHKSSDRGIPD